MSSRVVPRATLLLAAFLGSSVLSASEKLGPVPTARARRGIVSCATPEAARAGAEIIASGGNAVDAAIATAFALAVTYPQAGNLAGGGFLVARTKSGDFVALDFRETAPAGTWRNTFLNADGTPREDASTRSGLAVGTPGTVRGLEEAHRKLGRLPWARLLAPAIRLARDGFTVPRGLVEELEDQKKSLLTHAETRRVFFPAGAPLRTGSVLTQPTLADTLEEIARRGADGFHTGRVAERLAAFVRSEGGVLRAEDVEGYRPVWRPPAVIDFERWRLVTMPLPSAGGFLLQSILGQLPAVPGNWRAEGAAAMHLLAEVERRAYADRNRFLGDADCVDVPFARLLDPRRLLALGTSIDPARATPSSSVARAASRVESEDTTHLSTATADGEAVSLTFTLNDTFGNGSLVPGVGVFLNNEMDDFTATPGRPNLYGLIQSEANTVRAGGRPLSSMTPTIVLESGRPRFVIGSPGGSKIPTTVLQVFLHAGPRGKPLAEAVAAPRFHHQHLPDQILLERDAFPADVKAALERLGHRLEERRPKDPMGRVHAIAFEEGGSLVGAADPRGYGDVAGN